MCGSCGVSSCGGCKKGKRGKTGDDGPQGIPGAQGLPGPETLVFSAGTVTVATGNPMAFGNGLSAAATSGAAQFASGSLMTHAGIITTLSASLTAAPTAGNTTTVTLWRAPAGSVTFTQLGTASIVFTNASATYLSTGLNASVAAGDVVVARYVATASSANNITASAILDHL